MSKVKMEIVLSKDQVVNLTKANFVSTNSLALNNFISADSLITVNRDVCVVCTYACKFVENCADPIFKHNSDFFNVTTTAPYFRLNQ